jgi:hypothetical protein
MPIKFLNVPGSTNLRSSRPTGFKFPTGLSVAVAAGPTSVDYLVVAGGGGGGSGSPYGAGGGGGAGGYIEGSGYAITNGVTRNNMIFESFTSRNFISLIEIVPVSSKDYFGSSFISHLLINFLNFRYLLNPHNIQLQLQREIVLLLQRILMGF